MDPNPVLTPHFLLMCTSEMIAAVVIVNSYLYEPLSGGLGWNCDIGSNNHLLLKAISAEITTQYLVISKDTGRSQLHWCRSGDVKLYEKPESTL